MRAFITERKNIYRLLGLSGTAFVLATAAFWATLVTDPPKTEAETMIPFDINVALKTAPQDAPIQDGSVIGCTFILTDGHRCN